MAEYEAVATIELKATPGRVWEALTNPVQVKEYFFGTWVESSWQKGAQIRWTGEWEGRAYEDKGVVLVAEPERYLQYTYWSELSGKPDEPNNYVEVEYLLEPVPGSTMLTIRQEADSPEGKEHSESNWNVVLEQLQKYIDGNP